MDEIPIAHREIELPPTVEKTQTSFPIILILSTITIVFISSIGGFYLFRNLQLGQINSNSQPIQPVVDSSESETKINPSNESSSPSTPLQNNELNQQLTEKNSETEPFVDSETSESATVVENILGHLAYEEAPVEELKAVTGDGRIRLRKKAAEKFLAMQREAQRSGIVLTPISGFRTYEEQSYLFFNIKEQRVQDTTKRAEVSAPPQHSEHHTGYAIDIGDGNVPATHLSTSFDRTPAYRWLQANAAKYSFELSFTENNLQGITYEPWHWRYVGDTHSLETFYKARTLKTPLN